MHAQKTTVKLTIETLSLDSVPSLLIEIAESIRKENESGNIKKEDGDEANWETTYKTIEF